MAVDILKVFNYTVIKCDLKYNKGLFTGRLDFAECTKQTG